MTVIKKILNVFGGATDKNTPVDADNLELYDSAAIKEPKKVSLTNFKAFLKTYFDGIYATGTIPVKASASEINTGTDDAKFATALAIAGSNISKTKHIVVRKSTTETINNSATLQNDDELKFAIGANEVWQFEIFVMGATHGNAAIKMKVTVPTGATSDAHMIAQYNSTNVPTAASLSAQAETFGEWYYSDATGSQYLVIRGTVSNGSTAGDVQLQWAQSTVQVEDTQFLRGSYLVAHKIQ